MTAVDTRPARTFDAMLARLDRDIAEATRRKDIRGPARDQYVADLRARRARLEAECRALYGKAAEAPR